MNNSTRLFCSQLCFIISQISIAYIKLFTPCSLLDKTHELVSMIYVK